MTEKIVFNYQTDFRLPEEDKYSVWVKRILDSHGHTLDQLHYTFVDDQSLFQMNKKFLDHDTYTDILTFDYSSDKTISGEIFISTDRVMENARIYDAPFEIELQRVMAHGALHLLGFDDRQDDERARMRLKEEECIQLFHVEPMNNV